MIQDGTAHKAQERGPAQDELIEERFALAGERILAIAKGVEAAEIDGAYAPYFRETAAYIALLLSERRWLQEGGLFDAPLSVLREHNRAL